MADLRLLVIAPDPLARAGLATILDDRPGYEVVGQLSESQVSSTDLEIFQPDVIIWDMGWEPEEELSFLKDFTAEWEENDPAIIILLPDQEEVVPVWSDAIRGLLLRDVSPDRLLAAVTAAASGLATFDPLLLEALSPAVPLEDDTLVEELTPRELEVLQLLAEGLANKAIAQRLDISDHTVKFHVNAIMSKLGVQSRTAAVVRATRLGLIML